MEDRNEDPQDRYQAFREWLFKMDPEQAHGIGAAAARVGQRLAAGYLRKTFEFDHPSLEQWLWLMRFTNPVGLAAGFDKNAHLIPFAEQIGCGFTEVGSVSARPSRGNPKPRAFRLPDDQALINRMGLNNDGARRVSARIRRGRDSMGIPLGVNIAKTHDPAIVGDEAIADFVQTFRRVAPTADYVALNVSCPNTREGRTFEEPDAFDALVAAVMEARQEAQVEVPVLVKLSPPPTARVIFDSAVEEMVAISMERGIAGFIATNTAADRENLSTPESRLEEIGRGGVSGPPIEERANQMIRYLYARTEGKLPIIGVGGVRDGASAYRKFAAGASLVQIYTGLVYEGPALVQRVKRELVECLERDGYRLIREVVGRDFEEAPDRFSGIR